jgi:hypothetical protein
VVLLAVVAVILIGVIAVAVGRGGELEPTAADYRPVDLDDVTSTDVALMRPPTALFGYQREATDAAFGQIARAISDREVEIATLRRQLAEQLPVRTSQAMRDPSFRPDTGPLRPEPLPPGPLQPGTGFGAGPRPGAAGTESGPMTRASLPTRPPVRLPPEPPAGPPADELWQGPRMSPASAPPLPPRPVSSWPPPATTKAGSLLPEPMPNSSMPHIPWTSRDQTQGPSTPPPDPAGSPGTPGSSPPYRPGAGRGQTPSTGPAAGAGPLGGGSPYRPGAGRGQTPSTGPAGSAGAPGALLPSGSTQPPGPLPSRPAPPRPASSQPAQPRPATSAATAPAEPRGWSPDMPGTQNLPDPAAGTHGPDQGPFPSRPSVLHRELADRPAQDDPAAAADPWLVWQRRTDHEPGDNAAPPPAAPRPTTRRPVGPHPADDSPTDPGAGPGPGHAPRESP